MNQPLGRILGLTFLAAIALGSGGASADPATLPIADAHFHLMRFMTPEDLKARMEKNNVRWVVSSGAQGGPGLPSPAVRDAQALERIGPNFLPAVGASDIYVAERDVGVAFYDGEATAPRRQAVLDVIDNAFKSGRPVLPETFPNAENSSADPMRRRRLATDGPFFKALYDVATRNGRPLVMHLEWHPESMRQLESLLATQPKGVLVLQHCGKTTRAAQIRPVLEKYPQVFCDLAFRSPPQSTNESRTDPNRTIFWHSVFGGGIKPDWRSLIEDFPDRFMVAIDDVHSWSEYDDVVVAIRKGLLPQLKPETAEKLAYRNAVRVFQLDESGSAAPAK